jgi:hypothetical protein
MHLLNVPRAKPMVGASPGFPVGLGGIKELHAAFLTESRTREHGWCRVQEIRVAPSFSSHICRGRCEKPHLRIFTPSAANVRHPRYSGRIGGADPQQMQISYPAGGPAAGSWSAGGWCRAVLRRFGLAEGDDLRTPAATAATSISGSDAGAGMLSMLSRPSATRMKKSCALKRLPSGARTRW